MEPRGRVLLVLLLLLTVAAGAVLIGENRARQRLAPRSEQFQHLVGGLGFGPALDLSGGAFGFDPRLDDSCAEDCGPIPGGAGYYSRRAESVFYYAPRYHGEPLKAKEDDATPP